MVVETPMSSTEGWGYPPAITPGGAIATGTPVPDDETMTAIRSVMKQLGNARVRLGGL